MKNFKHTKINYDELIKEIVSNPKKVARDTESKYRRSVLQVVKKVSSDLAHNRIVLITGPSASGKTTTSNLLTSALLAKGVPCVVISMDDFYISAKDRQVIDGKIDYESLNALDIDLFKQCMNNLIKFNKSMMPRYDFINGEMQKEAYELNVTKDSVIIIEGIHAFNPEIISKEMEGKVYRLYVHTNSYFFSDYKIITPSTLRFFRRLVRDFHTRGATVEKTKNMWKGVIDGEQKYILPYKHLANKSIDTTHLYEPFIYLEEISKITQVDPEAEVYLTIFESEISFDRKLVSDKALVWEFLS